MKRVRVRFAPSPTGYLHIGGARTALFNWLFARHHGGDFILRIEDTDVARSTEESTRAILESLQWLGLDWDEGPGRGGPCGPYFQSERVQGYRDQAQRLLESGSAYRCYCTAEELAARRRAAMLSGEAPRYDGRCRHLSAAEWARFEAVGRGPAVRFRIPEGETIVPDLVRGRVRFANTVLDDFILLRSDGLPTYNFAAVVDDIAMRISHVIRGDEHLSNTPRQLLLYDALGFEPPQFAHIPMILGPDRSKLSKRHGATSVMQYCEAGYLPEAIVNYLALLGWSYDATQQLFSVKELVEKFSLEKVSKNPAVFDQKKLEWINAQYLRKAELRCLVGLAAGHLARAGLWGPEPERGEAWLERLILLVRDRIKTVGEIASYAGFFFTQDVSYEPEAFARVLRREGVPEVLLAVRESLAVVEPFTADMIERACRALISARGIESGALIHPARVALTGRMVSPGLFELIELLGRERTLRRLEKAARTVKDSLAGDS